MRPAHQAMANHADVEGFLGDRGRSEWWGESGRGAANGFSGLCRSSYFGLVRRSSVHLFVAAALLRVGPTTLPILLRMVTFDPNRPECAPYGLTCVRWNPAPMQRSDHHNEVELNFLETGWVTYLFGGRKVRVDAGRMHAFWAAIPHQIIDCGLETEFFVATIPLPCFLQCKLPDNLVQPLLQGQMIMEPTKNSRLSDHQAFARWEIDLADPHAGLKKAALLEMEARLLRLALLIPTARRNRKPGSGRAALSEAGLNKAEQMACVIAQRYTERLTIDEIGSAVKLHPKYAMSLFQKTFRTTLIEYLTQHRVSHSQGLLATTDMKIVDIAFSSGFGSISRFNDAFRRACGCSPREWQQHELAEGSGGGDSRQSTKSRSHERGR